jgi:hypothetical protein
MRFLLHAVLAALAAWWPKIQPGGEQTAFLSHLYIKTIFLPRQTRDKHRENSKRDRFLIGLISGDDFVNGADSRLKQCHQISGDTCLKRCVREAAAAAAGFRTLLVSLAALSHVFCVTLTALHTTQELRLC